MSEEIKDDGEVLEPARKVDNGFAAIGAAALEAMIVHCPIDFVLQFLLDQWYQPVRMHAKARLGIVEQKNADKKLLSGWHSQIYVMPRWLTDEMVEEHDVACQGLAAAIKMIEAARLARRPKE